MNEPLPPDSPASREAQVELRRANDALRAEIAVRRQTEEALRQSEARYRLMSENTGDVIWLLDLATQRFTYVSPSVQKLRGYSAEEIMAQDLQMALTPESYRFVAENLPPRIAGLMAGDESMRVQSSEVDQPCRDGSVVPTEVVTTLLTDAAGRVTQILGVTRNITERKRAEAALAVSEQKYRSFYQSVLDGFARVDMEGYINEANQSFLDMLGYSDEEVRRLHYRDITPERWHKIEDEILEQQVLRRTYSELYEKEYRRKDGVIFPVELRTYLIKDSQGTPTGMWAFIRDITGRKQAEEALRQLSGQLLRSQDEERRRIARELHDSTAQSLALLVMNLEMARAGATGTDPEVTRALAESSKLAQQCTDEVRTLSYLLHPPALEVFGLAGAVREYAEGFAVRSGLRVFVDVAPDLERLPEEVELAFFRVLQESLANVHRHSGSPTASIRLARSGAEIHLEVQDTGRGLPSACRLGVGIAGMKERLRLLGGRLEVESGQRGTTIRAVLPGPAANVDSNAGPARA